MKYNEVVNTNIDETIVDEDFDSQDQLKVERRIRDFYSKYRLDIKFNPHAFVRINSRTTDESSDDVSDWIQYYFLKLFGNTPEQIMKFRSDIQKATMIMNDRDAGLIYRVDTDPSNRKFYSIEDSLQGVLLAFHIFYPEWSRSDSNTKFPYKGKIEITIKTMFFSADGTSEDGSEQGRQWPTNFDLTRRPSFNEFLRSNNMSKKSDPDYYGHYKKIRPRLFDRFERAILNILEGNTTLYKGLYADQQKEAQAKRRGAPQQDIAKLSHRVYVGQYLQQYANEAKRKILYYLNNPEKVDGKIMAPYKFSSSDTTNLSSAKDWYSVQPSQFFPVALIKLNDEYKKLLGKVENLAGDEKKRALEEIKQWESANNYTEVMKNFVTKAENYAKSITVATAGNMRNDSLNLAASKKAAAEKAANEKSTAEKEANEKISQQNTAKSELIKLGYDEADAADWKAEVGSTVKSLSSKLAEKEQEYQQWRSYENNPQYKDDVQKIKSDHANIKSELEKYQHQYQLFNIAYPNLQESVLSESKLLKMRSSMSELIRIRELSGIK